MYLRKVVGIPVLENELDRLKHVYRKTYDDKGVSEFLQTIRRKIKLIRFQINVLKNMSEVGNG